MYKAADFLLKYGILTELLAKQYTKIGSTAHSTQATENAPSVESSNTSVLSTTKKSIANIMRKRQVKCCDGKNCLMGHSCIRAKKFSLSNCGLIGFTNALGS